MLADTDAGSVITVAQSGAQWGYRLLLPNLLLIPIMFIAQEMALRLGLRRGRVPPSWYGVTSGAYPPGCCCLLWR